MKTFPVVLLVWLLRVSSTYSANIELLSSSSLESLVAEVGQMGSYLVGEVGSVEFWFVKISDEQDLFHQLMLTEPFVSNPKRIVSDQSRLDVDASGKVQATLVIVILGEDVQDLSILLDRFEMNTRFMVIFPYRSQQQLTGVLYSFQSFYLFNILYVAIYPDNEHYTMFNYLIWKDVMNIVDGYHSLDQAFPDQGDLEGREVVGCTHPNGIFVGLDVKSGLPDGLHVKLVSLVISRVNGSLKIEFTDCLSTDSDSDCLRRKLSRQDCVIHFDRWQVTDATDGVPIMPMHALVLLVPRGGLFNTWDLLKAPYSPTIWMVLYSTAIICIVGMRVFFKRSGIEVLLHIVCGIGGSYLNRRSTLEKWISICLSLLMFVLLSAYEAKIVSFLANWPYLPDISSIDELHSAGIPVAIKNHFIPDSVHKDPRLQDLLIGVDQTTKIPPNFAVINDYESAKAVTNWKDNFNFETNRAHFVILDEPLDVQLSFFGFWKRNLLKNHFGQIYQRVQEVGFFNHWMNVISWDMSAFEKENQLAPRFIEFQQFKKFSFLFYTFWLVSGIVFLLELVWFHARKRRRVSPVRLRSHSYPFVRRSIKVVSARKSI